MDGPFDVVVDINVRASLLLVVAFGIAALLRLVVLRRRIRTSRRNAFDHTLKLVLEAARRLGPAMRHRILRYIDIGTIG